MPAISPCVGVPPGTCDALVPNGESYCHDCLLSRKRQPRKQHSEDFAPKEAKANPRRSRRLG